LEAASCRWRSRLPVLGMRSSGFAADDCGRAIWFKRLGMDLAAGRVSLAQPL